VQLRLTVEGRWVRSGKSGDGSLETVK
jgi:hypothetical protein